VPLDPEIKAVPLGEAELLRDGDDAAILALGTLVHPAVEAAVELGGDGLRVAVLNARFAKPLDAERILDLARRCGVLLTVEEHSVQGGFGAAVLELLAASGVSVPVRCLAIPDAVVEHGDPGTQKAAFGFDPEGIATAVRQLLAR
jgi:1-deoxy-D-xylulose-5-phosphate synthase